MPGRTPVRSTGPPARSAGSAHESAQHPLYVHGGAAMARSDIDHFEVPTFDGERLVAIDA
ncbi:hypothetical protein [[Kitasatospora] papulosa]|uniref:hypothetical protein n=1 Tax=[Kitasatospora] papulosa TaxID=1464011 RepID=UPI0036B97A01